MTPQQISYLTRWAAENLMIEQRVQLRELLDDIAREGDHTVPEYLPPSGDQIALAALTGLLAGGSYTKETVDVDAACRDAFRAVAAYDSARNWYVTEFAPKMYVQASPPSA